LEGNEKSSEKALEGTDSWEAMEIGIVSSCRGNQGISPGYFDQDTSPADESVERIRKRCTHRRSHHAESAGGLIYSATDFRRGLSGQGESLQEREANDQWPSVFGWSTRKRRDPKVEWLSGNPGMGESKQGHEVRTRDA